eukprot:1085297-Prymnesium_polylepis.1
MLSMGAGIPGTFHGMLAFQQRHASERGKQGQAGAIRGDQGRSGAISGNHEDVVHHLKHNQGQSGAIRGNQGQPGAIRGNQWQS